MLRPGDRVQNKHSRRVGTLLSTFRDSRGEPAYWVRVDRPPGTRVDEPAQWWRPADTQLPRSNLI